MLNFIRYMYRLYRIAQEKAQVQKRYPESKIHPDAKISSSISLGKHTQIGAGVHLRGNITIGKGSLVNGPSHLSAGNGVSIEIGNFCSIADYTCFFASNHPIHKLSTFTTANGFYSSVFSKNRGKRSNIKIGSDVWIGTHAVILSGVSIGDGAIIGAGSVVHKNVPPFAVVAGVPAKIIKYRFSEKVREYLSNFKWWEWEDQDILDKAYLFDLEPEMLTLERLSSVFEEENDQSL